ncbi:hypothetical protein [Nannocystis sp. SCPEA4]|uniref:hypothetical protein n=1 Tax=Nannocystis sp. SCPEA4 TaxID=2996787 RepID=UPI00226F7593|nr:hypothetical protein [Nannocystis sp. SCPEA4]MCY1062700.1 hypothetical protein [Nannocystis sp. SCPEA4]
MTGTSTNPGLALLFIPGTLFWVLVLAGIFTKNTFMIGGAVVLFVVTAVGALTIKARASSARNAERLRVWQGGTPGRARIVTIGTKGGGINGHPNIDFDLEVTLPGQEPYRVQVTSLVSKLAIPRVQPDTQIDVRVDPANKLNVLIDAALTPYGYE